MPDYTLIFRDVAEVRGHTLAVTAGSLPADLRGTLLRIGPGRQHAGSTPLHFLDGYAMVASARFERGQVTYQARHVDLPLAQREQTAGQLLARRPFTNRPGGSLANLFRLKLSTGAAHEVYAWGGSVVAADVDGHYCLEPDTLDTLGPAPINALGGGLAQLSAMPRLDPFSGNLLGYVMKPGMLGADSVTFVEFDAQWRERARVHRSLGVKGAVLHDLASTEHFYLVVQFGLLDVGKAAAGKTVVLDAVGLPSGAAKIIAIPRSGDGPMLQMPLPENHQGFHILNAFERDGELVVDTVIYEGLLDFGYLNPPQSFKGGRPAGYGPCLARHTMDLSSGAHRVSLHREAVGEAGCVRADRHGRPHRYAYLSSPGSRGDEPVGNAYYWFHGIGKIDCERGVTVATWDAGPRVFVSAPQFVACGTAEDEGWVLAWTLDAAREAGELVILDAQDLARGPVARFALPAPLPPASHVDWHAG